MTDLAAWLLEQLAEDEQVAHAAAKYAAPDSFQSMTWANPGDELGAVALYPGRALADLAAKRKIVALFMPPSDGSYDRWLGDEVLRILALPYVDRPGYQAAWRP